MILVELHTFDHLSLHFMLCSRLDGVDLSLVSQKLVVLPEPVHIPSLGRAHVEYYTPASRRILECVGDQRTSISD